MMKLIILTLSNLLVIVVATPAKVHGADRLIFWAFKDTTLVSQSIACAPDIFHYMMSALLIQLQPSRMKSVLQAGQNFEEILGDIPGGPYICGFVSMMFHTFKKNAYVALITQATASITRRT